jgi:hypothetical protein
VYLKGLRGLSTRLAHCSGGACQRSSSAPPLQPSPATWPLSRLYAALRSIDIDELKINPFRERNWLELLILRRRVSAKYPRLYGGLRQLKRLLTT